MLVKGNIHGNVYKKLINYASQKCDCILLKKYSDQNILETERVQKIIFSYNGFTEKKIMANYSKIFLNYALDFFKDNSALFDQEYIEKFEVNRWGMGEKDFLQLKKLNRKHVILDAIDRRIYDIYEKKWLELYEKDVVMIKEKIFDNGIKHQILYFCVLNSKTSKMLYEKDSILSWCYPESLEDICFLRKGCYWLESVAHEELCFINCESEEEYKYLKSIGISFTEDHYIPTKKEELYYEEY